MDGEQDTCKEKAKVKWQRNKNTKVFVHHAENPKFFLYGNGRKKSMKDLKL